MTAVKKQLRRDTLLAELEELGLLIDNVHVDLGNGFHGTSYLHVHPLLEDPYKVLQYAQQLRDRIHSDILRAVDVVVGPITGGALLGFAMAVAIDTSHHEPTARRVKFAPVYETRSVLDLRLHYRKLIAGQFMESGLKALVVDDVVNTGQTLDRCCELVKSSGGEVLGTAVLYDRSSCCTSRLNHYCLAQVQPDPGLVRAEGCQLCRLGTRIDVF